MGLPVECLHLDHLRVNLGFECFELFDLFFDRLNVGTERTHSVELVLRFLQELNQALLN